MTRPQNSSTNAVSLFPFLAVLVCAMGALIFLLIIITRRVRSDVVSHARVIQTVPIEAAKTEPKDEDELPEIVTIFPPEPDLAAPFLPKPEQLDRKKPIIAIRPQPVDPDIALRIEIASLTRGRSKRQKMVADDQAALSNARKRLNATEAKLARTKQQWVENRKQHQENNKLATSAMENERRLTAQLENTQKQIKRVRRQNAEEDSRYAFIPFDGVSGTTRRPILIECSGSGLQFVPEGIWLTLEDLERFTLEVNPLLSGARSLAEYFSRKDSREQTEGKKSQPYVLLLVRPSGSVSYYAARKLLMNMQRPFGYELIEEDWKLDLPEVDPEARRICRAAVDETEVQRKSTVKPFAIGRGTGTGGRMIRFHKESGSFEVVDSDSSSSGGNDPLFTNRNSRNVERNSTGLSQREPSIPRRKVIDVTGVPSGGFDTGASFNPNRKKTGYGLNDDERRSGRTGTGAGTGAKGSFQTRNLTGKKSDGKSLSGKSVSRNSDLGKTGTNAKSASGSTKETEATGRIGFRNDFQEQNRFPKPLIQNLEKNAVTRKDPLRNERLYEWTDTGIERGGVKKTQQDWDPHSRDKIETKTASGNHRSSGTSHGELADSKAVPLDPRRAFSQEANSRRQKGISTRSSTSGSKTASGKASQFAASDDVNVSQNRVENRDRQRTSRRTSRSSLGKGPVGSRPVSANRAGAPSVSGRLQRTKNKRAQSSKVMLHRRRWGKSGPGASIGFERKMLIQIDANRLIVGRNDTIDIDSLGRNNPELLEQVLIGIEREALSWGMPPTSFYWVPKIRFRVAAGGRDSAVWLKNSLKQAGLFSQIEYVQASSKSQQRPE